MAEGSLSLSLAWLWSDAQIRANRRLRRSCCGLAAAYSHPIEPIHCAFFQWEREMPGPEKTLENCHSKPSDLKLLRAYKRPKFKPVEKKLAIVSLLMCCRSASYPYRILILIGIDESCWRAFQVPRDQINFRCCFFRSTISVCHWRCYYPVTNGEAGEQQSNHPNLVVRFSKKSSHYKFCVQLDQKLDPKPTVITVWSSDKFRWL